MRKLDEILAEKRDLEDEIVKFDRQLYIDRERLKEVLREEQEARASLKIEPTVERLPQTDWFGIVQELVKRRHGRSFVDRELPFPADAGRIKSCLVVVDGEMQELRYALLLGSAGDIVWTIRF